MKPTKEQLEEARISYERGDTLLTVGQSLNGTSTGTVSHYAKKLGWDRSKRKSQAETNELTGKIQRGNRLSVAERTRREKDTQARADDAYRTKYGGRYDDAVFLRKRGMCVTAGKYGMFNVDGRAVDTGMFDRIVARERRLAAPVEPVFSSPMVT